MKKLLLCTVLIITSGTLMPAARMGGDVSAFSPAGTPATREAGTGTLAASAAGAGAGAGAGSGSGDSHSLLKRDSSNDDKLRSIIKRVLFAHAPFAAHRLFDLIKMNGQEKTVPVGCLLDYNNICPSGKYSERQQLSFYHALLKDKEWIATARSFTAGMLEDIPSQFLATFFHTYPDDPRTYKEWYILIMDTSFSYMHNPRSLFKSYREEQPVMKAYIAAMIATDKAATKKFFERFIFVYDETSIFIVSNEQETKQLATYLADLSKLLVEHSTATDLNLHKRLTQHIEYVKGQMAYQAFEAASVRLTKDLSWVAVSLDA